MLPDLQQYSLERYHEMQAQADDRRRFFQQPYRRHPAAKPRIVKMALTVLLAIRK